MKQRKNEKTPKRMGRRLIDGLDGLDGLMDRYIEWKRYR